MIMNDSTTPTVEEDYKRRAELAASRCDELLHMLQDVAKYLDHDTTARGSALNARVHAVIAKAPSIVPIYAAAPVLLDALKEAARVLVLEGYESYAVLQVVRAAIAKAEAR